MHGQAKEDGGRKGINIKLRGEEVKYFPPYILPILADECERKKDASHLYPKKSLINRRRNGAALSPSSKEGRNHNHINQDL